MNLQQSHLSHHGCIKALEIDTAGTTARSVVTILGDEKSRDVNGNKSMTVSRGSSVDSNESRLFVRDHRYHSAGSHDSSLRFFVATNDSNLKDNEQQLAGDDFGCKALAKVPIKAANLANVPSTHDLIIVKQGSDHDFTMRWDGLQA